MEAVLAVAKRLFDLIPRGKEPVAEALTSLPALSHSQCVYIWQTLKRYEFSLGMVGVKVPEEPQPPAAPPVVLPSEPFFCDFIGGKFVLRLGDRHAKYINEVPRNKYDRKTQLYTVPYRLVPVMELHKFIKKTQLFYTDAAKQAMVDMHHEVRERRKWSGAHDAEIDMQGFGLALDPYQRAGIKGALRFRRGFIADAMGLGKTRQALGVLFLSRAYPALVICPASVVLNWAKEAEGKVEGGTHGILVPLPNGELPRIWRAKTKQVPEHSCTQAATQLGSFSEARFDEHCPRCQFDNAHLIIVNYHKLSDGWKCQFDESGKKIKGRKREKGERAEVQLSPLAQAIKARGVQFFVGDESYYFKNEQTQMYKAVYELAGGATYRLALSGTPIKSRVSELIAQLKVVDRIDDLGGEDVFYRRFVDTPGQEKALNDALRSIGFIQRNKRDVRKDLPPVRYATIWVDIDNREEYERVEEDVVNWCADQAVLKNEFLRMLQHLPDDQHDAVIERKKIETRMRTMRAAALIRIGALKRVAAKGKVGAVTEWIQEFLQSENKLVAFAEQIAIQKKIQEIFGCLHIFGADDIQTRQLHKEIFQGETGNILGLNQQMIMCSLGAAREGVSLDAADDLLLIERPWTPAEEMQAIARIDRHRVHNITAYRAMAVDTIEEMIDKRLADRQRIVEAVTSGKLPEDAGKRAIHTSVIDEVFSDLAALSANARSGEDTRALAVAVLANTEDISDEEAQEGTTDSELLGSACI